MKKIIIAFLIFAIMLPSATLLSGCGGGGGFVPGTPSAYITLNINPSVEIITDNNDQVIAINAVNDEGAQLFYEQNYIGYEVDVALRNMIRVAAELGYIPAYDEENAGAVFVSVFGVDSEVKGRVFSAIKSSVDDFFEANGLFAVVAETVMDNKIITDALKNNMDSANVLRFRAILKAMEYDADLEFTEGVDLTTTKLVKKIFDEMQKMSQIASKAQKDAYLDNRITLKQTFEDDLVVLFDDPNYTQLYNELKALKEEYRTTTDVDYANDTIIPLIDAKEEEIEPIETVLKSQHATQIASMKATYAQTINNSLTTFKEASIADMPDFDTIITNKKIEFMWRLEERQQYAQYSENNFANEYGLWKPLIGTNLTSFATSLESYSQVRTATKNEVLRALSRLNPYTRSEFFGDSSGVTFTF